MLIRAFGRVALHKVCEVQASAQLSQISVAKLNAFQMEEISRPWKLHIAFLEIFALRP